MAAPVLTLRDTSDVEITTLDFGTITAGQTSTVVEIRVWNDYGGTNSSDAAQNVSLKVLNEDGEEEGELVENCWLEYKVGSEDDTATPSIVETSWKPMGLGFYPSLGTIQSNTYRTVYLRLRVPIGSSTDSLSFYIAPFYSAIAEPIDPVIYELSEDGIISEEGNEDFNVKEGLYVRASGGETVTVEEGIFYYNGVPKRSLGGDIVLDQYDVNSNPLTTDYLVYGAIISLASDGSVSATKGERQETSAIYPDTPEGELLLAKVDVVYQEGGTSVINQEDVQWQITGTEFMLTDTSEDDVLGVIIGAGRCVVNGKYVSRSSTESISLAANSEKRVSVSDAGLIVQDATDDSSVVHLYYFIVDGTTVYTYDLRHFIGQKGFWSVAGSTIAKGTPVVPGAFPVVDAVTADSSTGVMGIAEHDAFPEDNVFIVNKGRCLALLTGSYSAGDVLVSEASGRLQSNNSADAKAKVGIALESGSGAKLRYILL